MLKIVNIVGTRPQFIKLSSLIIVNQRLSKKINLITINTGQHFDKNMSDIFIKDLKIPKPKYNLGVGGKSNNENIANIILKIEKVLIKEKPNAVIVFGDTDSTLAGSLAANKLDIKILHIEAGLRSFDKNMPEEINRILVDHMSFMHFCPSKVSKQNLINEGLPKKNIYITGDIMLDTLKKFYLPMLDILNKLKIQKNKYVFLTIHRKNNTQSIERLNQIIKKISEIGMPVIWPAHPRIKQFLKKLKITNNIKITEPVSYNNSLNLQKNAKFVITDSGGIQKESYYLKTQCFVLRKSTEWIELNERKKSFLIKNINTFNFKKLNKKLINGPNFENNIYGNGKASNKIIDIIVKNLSYEKNFNHN